MLTKINSLDNAGQAIFEFFLLIAVIVSMMVAFERGIRSVINKQWQMISCETASACPSCPAPPEIKNRLSEGVCR